MSVDRDGSIVHRGYLSVRQLPNNDSLLARSRSRRYSSRLNSHPQYWPASASGGQCRQVVRIRESMVRAKVSNSTVPTLLQGKSRQSLAASGLLHPTDIHEEA